MTTVTTFTAIRDGWGLVGHFIGNTLPILGFEIRHKSDEVGNRWDRNIENTRAQLAGNLAMIVYRMRKIGYQDQADNIEQLFNFVAENSLIDTNQVEGLRALLKKLQSQQDSDETLLDLHRSMRR